MGSRLTRKELVLQLLRQHAGEWVDGPRIASAEVGGSEGLKRLRELRMDGYDIRMRKHPDQRRDIFQYRLNVPFQTATIYPSASFSEDDKGNVTVTPASPREFPLKRDENGEIEIEWKVCEECGGRYAVLYDHINGEEHRRWIALSQTVEGSTAIPPVAPPVVYAYIEKPVGVKFGDAAVCPRCKGVRRPARVLKSGFRPADDMCMDPKDYSILCRRCNGWGIVPNVGPVPMVITPAPPEQKEPPPDPETSEAFPSE